MAKKSANKTSKPTPVFSLGDRVEIRHFGLGTITELRGPLGPAGAQIYRVLYRRKPTAGYIEVLGSQLRPARLTRRRGTLRSKLPTAADASDETGT